jgi:hypothetical protein
VAGGRPGLGRGIRGAAGALRCSLTLRARRQPGCGGRFTPHDRVLSLASAAPVGNACGVAGSVLGAIGGVLELGLWALWFWLLRRVRIPADRRPVLVAHAVAAGLGVAGLLLGAGTLGSVLAVLAVVGGGSYLGLAAQSAQAPRVPAVALGGTVIDFTLPDHAGVPFDLATLRGKPFLLKFFRGHW